MEVHASDASPCLNCAVRNGSFCGALTSDGTSPVPREHGVPQVHATAEPQDILCRQSEWSPDVFVLCSGWALRVHRLSDGRRQALSLIHPGDLFSASTLFDPCPEFSVQALTDIRFCKFNRIALKQQIVDSPNLIEAVGRSLAAEIDEMNDTAVNLRRSDPKERLLHFLARLVERLAARHVTIRTNSYPFPLSTLQIAQLTGLTPADVNRALTMLHDDFVIDLKNGILTVLDTARLNGSVAPNASAEQPSWAFLAARAAATLPPASRDD